MAEELDLYTGTLLFREISFTFAFDKKELRLIPPEDKTYVVEWEWQFMCTALELNTSAAEVEQRRRSD